MVPVATVPMASVLEILELVVCRNLSLAPFSDPSFHGKLASKAVSRLPAPFVILEMLICLNFCLSPQWTFK
jgi:hypothetical protein